MQIGSWVCHLTPGWSHFGLQRLDRWSHPSWSTPISTPRPPSGPGLCLLFPHFITANLFPLPLGTLVLEASRSSLVFSPDEAFPAPFCLGHWGLSHQSLPFLGASFSDSPCCLPGVLLPLHVFLQPLIFLKLADMHGGPSVPERRLFGHRKKCQGRGNWRGREEGARMLSRDHVAPSL